MKSDGLTSKPIFLQSIRPLLRPYANGEKLHVCLVVTMPCRAHIVSSRCANHMDINIKLRTAQPIWNLRMLDHGCRVEGVTLFS
jgi:hypothetical protein